jgi:hypothetical protein
MKITSASSLPCPCACCRPRCCRSQPERIELERPPRVAGRGGLDVALRPVCGGRDGTDRAYAAPYFARQQRASPSRCGHRALARREALPLSDGDGFARFFLNSPGPRS